MGKIGRRITRQIWADTASNRPAIVYPWMLKHGVNTLRITDELRAEDGSITQTLAYRYAQVLTDFPGAWTVTGTTRSANGAGTTDVDVSAVTDQMWVQPALFVKSAGAMAQSLSSLQVSTEGDSRVVASGTIQVNAEVNTGEFAYIPIGRPFSALQLTSLMFSAVIFGVDGTTLLFQPIMRSFTARLDQPGAWSTLDSGQTTTTEVLYNSGSETVAPGAVQYAQVGMRVGGINARGTIQVAVAGKF